MAEVWWARRQDAGHALADLLNDADRARWRGFRRHEDRDRFLVGCALTKTVVARHTGQRPADVQLDRTCGRCGELHGKPAVQGSGLEVSVTHSGALVAVGVAAGTPLGVDVEQLDRERLPATEAFVRSVLSAGEQARLAVAADPVRTLLVAWTRKEAVTKATGDGLRIPFRQVVVSGADEPPLLLSWPYPSSPGTVTLFDLDAGSGYVASLAVIGSCAAVRARDGSGLLRGTASPLATGLEFE